MKFTNPQLNFSIAAMLRLKSGWRRFSSAAAFEKLSVREAMTQLLQFSDREVHDKWACAKSRLAVDNIAHERKL